MDVDLEIKEGIRVVQDLLQILIEEQEVKEDKEEQVLKITLLVIKVSVEGMVKVEPLQVEEVVKVIKGEGGKNNVRHNKQNRRKQQCTWIHFNKSWRPYCNNA